MVGNVQSCFSNNSIAICKKVTDTTKNYQTRILLNVPSVQQNSIKLSIQRNNNRPILNKEYDIQR